MCVQGGGRERSERGFFQPRAQRAGFFCAAGAIFQRVLSDFNNIVDLLPPFAFSLYATVAHVQYLQTSVTYSFSFVIIVNSLLIEDPEGTIK